MVNPIYKKDGFLFFSQVERVQDVLGDRLIIEESKIKETIEYVKRNKINNITINPSYSKVENLEFLKEMDAIEGLYLLQTNLNISALSCLNKLRVLTIADPKPQLDLAHFPLLEVLGISYSKKLSNISSCKKLFWLWLDNYDEPDFEMLSGLDGLAFLTLHKAKNYTLNGVSNLTNLKELHVDIAKNLVSVNDISENNSSLKFIDIFNAPNLVDYEALKFINNIQKIRLAKSGDLKSLSFLKNLDKLEKVSLGIKVLDGDMTPLKGISDVSFLNFPHYNLELKDFKN